MCLPFGLDGARKKNGAATDQRKSDKTLNMYAVCYTFCINIGPFSEFVSSSCLNVAVFAFPIEIHFFHSLSLCLLRVSSSRRHAHLIFHVTCFMCMCVALVTSVPVCRISTSHRLL